MRLSRDEIVSRRIAAQELDVEDGTRPLTSAALLDLGVQDTGHDGASWALANRGVAVDPDALVAAEDLALVWSLRASPHYYRRADLPEVMVATSPFSESDAAKRVVGAGKPLAAAGIGVLDGLAEVATQLEAVVDRPRVKGEVSGLLTARMSEPYLRECRSCGATHPWEVPFRIGALYAGLELEPGTSPPVMRRIPDWPDRPPGPAPDPAAAPARLQVVRGYLRFLGPATPAEVATFLDGAVAEVKRHWPADAIEVDRDGTRAWMLPDQAAASGQPRADLVRLLGPYDVLLQGRDRALLVPDRDRHAELWPVLGRPGAVLAGTDVVGTWRPKASGTKLTLRLRLWTKVSARMQARIEEQAELLARHRGSTLTRVEREE